MKKTFLSLVILVLFQSIMIAQNQKGNDSKLFTESFKQDSTFSTTGRNQYFILEPGYQLILEGMEDKDSVRLLITVLKETKVVGGIITRVVEENESVNGKIVEISRNYFAFSKQTRSIFYFGEDVDMFKDGKVINHDGSWLAEGKNKAGIGMPGLILLGARYYQEIAPDLAMDRAEIISISETFKTPAGNFSNCLKTEETTALNVNEKEFKLYAPGIGLIKDEELLLVKYGFLK
jgi:hypothetical protein